jgi:hypothetical protein
MHYVIDIVAAMVLLFMFFAGWKKGLLLASLSIVRVILAYGMAYFAGRYLGSWLGEVFYRPRIVIIPVTAGLTFIFITFAFKMAMWKIRERHKAKEELEEHYHLPYYSCFFGGIVSMASGLLTMIFVFWLGDLSLTGLTGHGIPGSDESRFGRVAHRAIYETVYLVTAREGRESQAAAIARAASNPAKGLDHLQRVLSADSVKQLLSDRQLPADLLSGDPDRIQQNASMQRLIKDHATRAELKELGIISREENKNVEILCEKLARFGQNENIQTSLQNLRARDMLRTDRILELIRDPDFDIIVAEVVK